MTKWLRGRDFLVAVCRSQGIDPDRVQRVVIDADAAGVTKLYVQMLASPQILEVGMLESGAVQVRVIDAPRIAEVG